MKALMRERIDLSSGILISGKATFLLSGLCHFYSRKLFTDVFALLRLSITVWMAQMMGRGNSKEVQSKSPSFCKPVSVSVLLYVQCFHILFQI